MCMCVCMYFAIPCHCGSAKLLIQAAHLCVCERVCACVCLRSTLYPFLWPEISNFAHTQPQIRPSPFTSPPRLSARLKSIELTCISPVTPCHHQLVNWAIPHFLFISAVKYTRFRGFETKALQTNGLMDGRTNGPTYGWMDGWMDGRTDGQTL